MANGILEGIHSLPYFGWLPASLQELFGIIFAPVHGCWASSTTTAHDRVCSEHARLERVHRFPKTRHYKRSSILARS